MKEKFEEKGIRVIAHIDRPICYIEKDGNEGFGCMRDNGELVCVLLDPKEAKNARIKHRMVDLQDDISIKK